MIIDQASHLFPIFMPTSGSMSNTLTRIQFDKIKKLKFLNFNFYQTIGYYLSQLVSFSGSTINMQKMTSLIKDSIFD